MTGPFSSRLVKASVSVQAESNPRQFSSSSIFIGHTGLRLNLKTAVDPNIGALGDGFKALMKNPPNPRMMWITVHDVFLVPDVTNFHWV